MVEQEQKFVAPGFDANLYECDQCNDSGISAENGGYCTSCRMGKRIEKLDAWAENLKSHGFTNAMRMVFRSTQKTERAIAAADKALLLDKLAKLEKKVTETEARAFTMSEQLDDMAKQLHERDLKIATLIHEKAKASLGNNWININDRLPVVGEQCYISILHEYTNAPSRYSMSRAFYCGGSVWSDSMHFGNQYHQPTHWMSAEPPAPPSTSTSGEQN